MSYNLNIIKSEIPDQFEFFPKTWNFPKEKLEFKEGSFVYIFKGKQKGRTGILKKVENTNDLQSKKITFIKYN